MRPCPFCRNEIQDEAIKCQHCSSLLVPMPPSSDAPAGKPELDSRQVWLVLDRGFLYFAKFVAAVGLLIVAAGAAFFGFDLNKAREDVERMRTEIEKIEEQAKKISAEAQTKLDETEHKLADIEKAAEEEHKQFQQKLQTSFVQTSGLPQGVTTPEPPPKGSFTVPEIMAAYDFPKNLNGAGRTIGLLELGGGYRQADIDRYFSNLHLSTPAITPVSVDRNTNRPDPDTGANGQVEGDIEVTGAIAPKANIRVYFAPNTNRGFVDAIAAATRDHVSVLSISWGSPELRWTPDVLERMQLALKEAASAGITVVVAAGDNGVTDGVSDGLPHVDFPASSPWALAVGGTTLTVKEGAIISEVAWNTRGQNATGGGVSGIFPLPDWQRAAGVPARQDRSIGRGIPDVAAVADPETGYQLLINGTIAVIGGTAMAAPLWAGLVALLDQGSPRDLGYLNPRLYQEIGPAKILRLITEGNNSVAGVPGFSAGPGWNAVAGWGSPNGAKLLEFLRAHPT